MVRVRAWLEAAGLTGGPLFQRSTGPAGPEGGSAPYPSGHRPATRRRGRSRVLVSGHSLRVGGAQSLAAAAWRDADAGRWQSPSPAASRGQLASRSAVACSTGRRNAGQRFPLRLESLPTPGRTGNPTAARRDCRPLEGRGPLPLRLRQVAQDGPHLSLTGSRRMGEGRVGAIVAERAGEGDAGECLATSTAPRTEQRRSATSASELSRRQRKSVAVSRYSDVRQRRMRPGGVEGNAVRPHAAPQEQRLELAPGPWRSPTPTASLTRKRNACVKWKSLSMSVLLPTSHRSRPRRGHHWEIVAARRRSFHRGSTTGLSKCAEDSLCPSSRHDPPRRNRETYSAGDLHGTSYGRVIVLDLPP